MTSDQHTPFLDQTLRLAGLARGRVSPNPLVGALVVRDGEIVAAEYHRCYGGEHAEALALRAAGHDARGATLYCSLEPCSYDSPEKHQPPCTGKIIAAGITRVVIGQLDPNPRVRGAGVRVMRQAGIDVRTAEDSGPFWRFNRVFNTGMAHSRPFIQLKCAMSLDGRMATAAGNSKWITDDEARTDSRRLRGEHDAVAVGIGTVLADDPLLTARSGGGREPRPVVFDTALRTPPDSQLAARRGNELILLCGEPRRNDPEFARRRRRLLDLGVTVLSTESSPGEGIRPDSAATLLFSHGVRSLLVEGGAALLTSFFRRRLFDRVSAYIAPLVLGSGTSAVGDLGITSVADALAFEAVEWRRIGNQQLFEAYRRGWLEEVQRSVRTEEVAVCSRE